MEKTTNLRTNLSQKVTENQLFIYFHLAIIFVNVAVLAAPLPWVQGWKLLGLVVLYNVSLPLLAKYAKLDHWWSMWTFLLPLSVFQVLPDWFLSRVLDVLVFPADGSWRIGTVSAYMAGMWVVPMFLVLYGAYHSPQKWQYASAALLGLLIFGASEATSYTILGSWYAQKVWIIQHVAIYVLLPEALLGLAGFYAWQQVQHSSWGKKIVAALMVSLVYTGALAVSFLLIERF